MIIELKNQFKQFCTSTMSCFSQAFEVRHSLNPCSKKFYAGLKSLKISQSATGTQSVHGMATISMNTS